MKYAKVKDGRIVDVVEGLQPEGYKPVKKMWQRPTDYPSDFYSPDSNIPRYAVVDDEPQETWGFNLKSVEAIKEFIYEIRKVDRYKLQMSSFVFNSIEIPIGDRETSLLIASMPEVETNYKLSNNNWLTISAAEIPAFKEAHRLHVQNAYDWEKSETDLVSAMTTHNELKVYLENNT